MTKWTFNLDGHMVEIEITSYVKAKSRGKIIFDARASCPIKRCPKSAIASFACYKKETGEQAKREVMLKLQKHYSKEHKTS
jgi:hypothetical protein